MAKIKTGKNISKQEVIIREAVILFKAKGYSAASMRDLAVAVGVEAPSLYNHIGSKSELLQAICFKVGNEFMDYVDIVEKQASTNAEKIETIIRFHIKMMLQDFDEIFVANHEWKHLKEPYFTDFLVLRRNYEKRLITLIETGIRDKEFKSINPYIAVITILSAVRGLEFLHRHKNNFTNQTLENDMVNHLLNGIKQ